MRGRGLAAFNCVEGWLAGICGFFNSFFCSFQFCFLHLFPFLFKF